MVEVTATIKYLKIGPKKLRELISAVKNLSCKEAILQLKFTQKSGSKLLSSAIESAMANSKANLKTEGENLFVKNVEVNEGPKFKRFRAVSQGSAHSYVKRTSHIKVTLEEIKNGQVSS